MAVKTPPIQYPVGIEDLAICFMKDKQDTLSALPEYEDDVYSQTNITNLGIAGTNSTFEKWASNQLIISISRNTKYTLTFDLAGIAQEIYDRMKDNARTKGIAFNSSNPKEFPKFAIGVIFPMNDGTRKARWYPRCQLAPADETYQTLTEEMDIPDQQHVIEALPLLYNKNTVADFYDGDPTNAASALTVSDFLKQVICDESQLAALTGTGSPANLEKGGDN